MCSWQVLWSIPYDVDASLQLCKDREIVFSPACNVERSRLQQKNHLKWKLSRRDYWPSNRVLASTLRLNPYSITGISGDVPPAPALHVCRFTAPLIGHSGRPLITGGWPESHRPTPFRLRSPLQLKSIRPSPVKQPFRERRAPLSFSLIPGLKILIGTPKTESSDPQLSH